MGPEFCESRRTELANTTRNNGSMFIDNRLFGRTRGAATQQINCRRSDHRLALVPVGQVFVAFGIPSWIQDFPQGPEAESW